MKKLKNSKGRNQIYLSSLIFDWSRLFIYRFCSNSDQELLFAYHEGCHGWIYEKCTVHRRKCYQMVTIKASKRAKILSRLFIYRFWSISHQKLLVANHEGCRGRIYEKCTVQGQKCCQMVTIKASKRAKILYLTDLRFWLFLRLLLWPSGNTFAPLEYIFPKSGRGPLHNLHQGPPGANLSKIAQKTAEISQK